MTACPRCTCPCALVIFTQIACPNPACRLYDERRRVEVELQAGTYAKVTKWAWEQLKATHL